MLQKLEHPWYKRIYTKNMLDCMLPDAQKHCILLRCAVAPCPGCFKK